MQYHAQTDRDFTFRRSGAYTNVAPLPRPRRVASVRRNAGWGSTCGGCGLARSRSNKCDCNQK
jgi:hypothetical protein